MVCFLRLLSRTITPNRTSTKRCCGSGLYALLHSLLKATRITELLIFSRI